MTTRNMDTRIGTIADTPERVGVSSNLRRRESRFDRSDATTRYDGTTIRESSPHPVRNQALAKPIYRGRVRNTTPGVTTNR